MDIDYYKQAAVYKHVSQESLDWLAEQEQNICATVEVNEDMPDELYAWLGEFGLDKEGEWVTLIWQPWQ